MSNTYTLAGFPSLPALFDNLVWMNSKEAAQYLRMSANALRIAVSRGQLRARKWRRRLFFKKVDLDLMLEGSHRNKQR